jgi:8-oxo-dGTP pyrophosphatase MutT (NUDIX family)
LIDIGVASYKIATAVKGVLAQRLVRRLCGACHGALGAECADCGTTGFHGRLALVEVLIASAEFERRVAAGESTERIAEAAREDGMRTLWKSGLAHVAAGNTTHDEVLRVATADPPARDTSATPRQVVSEAAPQIAAGFLPFDGGAFDLRDDLDTRATRARLVRRNFRRMTTIEAGTVDVFVIRQTPGGLRVLALQRALDTRCPGAWEPVHGHIEAGEEPEDAALRELREETGLGADKLYIVRVVPFYLRKRRAIELAVVFGAFVSDERVTTANEHQAFEWLTVNDALGRFGFPTERQSLREVVDLLGSGDAGAVEDVTRVR